MVYLRSAMGWWDLKMVVKFWEIEGVVEGRDSESSVVLRGTVL